ncbi:GPCR kinase [Tanacetum coccineum]|uniref:GPCR kinase n=1 Tax=Tanacetum coccineum TaxID=301880 RepID=A0ABQ5GNT9_9ASTR
MKRGYQLHLDEEALRETLEEQAMDAKAREEKISLDIDDSDLNITHVLRSSSSARVEPSPYTPTPVRIISGLAGTVQKVVEDVGEDSDFNSGAWISATNYVLSTGGTVTGYLGDINNFLEKGKLKQVVAIVKSCSLNCLGDLNVTMKDLSGTVRETVHHKLLDVGTYGNDIHVGTAMILANVSVFTPKPSEHYLNIIKKNVVKMDPNFTNENDPWEYNLDIDDFDLNITPVMRSSSSARVEPSPYTPTPVRIIPGPAGTVQKVVEDVGEDFDFNSRAWINATNYVLSTGGTVTGYLGDINNFLEKGKLKQVVTIVKSCSPNCLGDLNVTMKDLSGTVRETVHHKLLDVGTYGKDIHVGAAMILANVSVFTPKPSEHYLNITKKNVVKVFRKDTVSLT